MPEQDDHDQTITVRVLRGTHRRADGTRAGAGETVRMTETQLSRFPPEKFERVDAETVTTDESGEDGASDDSGESASISPEPAKKDVSANDAAESDDAFDVPDDYTILRSMAAAYDGDEVNGQSSKDEIRAFLSSIPADDAQLLYDAVN